MDHVLSLPPSIYLDNLTVSYQRHPVIHHLSGVFEAGQLTAIVGPNGAGKSTLLKTLVGLNTNYQGIISGVDIKRTAYLPQQSELNQTFPMQVLDVVALGDWQQSSWFGRITQTQKNACLHALEQVGLAGFGHRYIDELSVGQMQRVMFARLMVQNADVIILDEPFAALDSKTTHDLLQLIQGWQHAKRTVIAVLHDLSQVKNYFSYTLLLAKSCVAWGETHHVLTEHNLSIAYQTPLQIHKHAPVCTDN